MRAAFFSKSTSEKSEFALQFVNQCNTASVIYVYSKNREREKVSIPGSYSVSFEDITKTEHWLRINNIAGDNCALVLDNPSRYPKITSEKFRHLYRLAMHVKHKLVLDIVPFTLDIQYLYTPFCYLGRDILGYAHYYAFRENYYEMDESGNVHSAHDFDVLAHKIACVSQITYSQFLCKSRTVMECRITDDESEQYARRKSELFAKYKSPQKIVTRLADTMHAFESRKDKLLELLPKLNGSVVIYTNLSTYARRIRQVVGDDVKVTSYQTGAVREFDNCIYFESPIVKTYLLLDAESRLPEHCRVFHFLSDAKVDVYLYEQLQHELEQINSLTKELYHVTQS